RADPPRGDPGGGGRGELARGDGVPQGAGARGGRRGGRLMAGSAVRRRGIIAEINVTPLVDIMLVLLIIFMLTAHLIARQAIEIELPRASQSSTVKPTTLVVQLTRDGELSLNGQATTPDGLRGAIRSEVA